MLTQYEAGSRDEPGYDTDGAYDYGAYYSNAALGSRPLRHFLFEQAKPSLGGLFVGKVALFVLHGAAPLVRDFVAELLRGLSFVGGFLRRRQGRGNGLFRGVRERRHVFVERRERPPIRVTFLVVHHLIVLQDPVR